MIAYSTSTEHLDPAELSGYLSCAPGMAPFHEAAGFSSGTAMSRRKPPT